MSSIVMSLPVYGTLNINNLLLGLDLSIDKLHTTARHGFYLMVDIDSGFLTGCVLSPLSALIVGIYQRTKTQQLSASFILRHGGNSQKVLSLSEQYHQSGRT